jgi:Uma2 family endonuclease
MSAEPQVRQWTRDEVYQMDGIGLFFGQRAELIEGQVLVMSTQRPEHYFTIDRMAETLRRALPSNLWVRQRAPLSFSPTSEPEPDLSVVIGNHNDYQDHPTSAVLVVEVSDTTLAFDRGQKASLYARAGIADYWIVNLVDRRLEVRRTPVADATQLYGHGYASLTELVPPAAVNLLAAPQVSLAVADLIA